MESHGQNILKRFEKDMNVSFTRLPNFAQIYNWGEVRHVVLGTHKNFSKNNICRICATPKDNPTGIAIYYVVIDYHSFIPQLIKDNMKKLLPHDNKCIKHILHNSSVIKKALLPESSFEVGFYTWFNIRDYKLFDGSTDYDKMLEYAYNSIQLKLNKFEKKIIELLINIYEHNINSLAKISNEEIEFLKHLVFVLDNNVNNTKSVLIKQRKDDELFFEIKTNPLR